MSPNPYPFFTISPEESPEQIQLRIALLIRLYLKHKNQFVATSVVEHINAILSFPGFIVDIEQRCGLRRLAAHWCCLAWIDSKNTSPSIE